MALRLHYTAASTIPVEVDGLTPEALAGLSRSETERFEVFQGNRRVPLAELFRISGDLSDERIDWSGDLQRVHGIGTRMNRGTMHVEGSCGRHLGSGLNGGRIDVHGDAGTWVGAEMRGGLIHIRGSAGDQVGGAYRGATRGMRGGVILIDGNAGHEVGHTMRRGLIAVGGAAGDMIGCNMIAGTILVFGNCGVRPGAGMRRGTIGVFGPVRPALLPTFRPGSTCEPQIVRILLRHVQSRGLTINPTLMDAQYDLFHGDLVTLGRGEILFPHVKRGDSGV